MKKPNFKKWKKLNWESFWAFFEELSKNQAVKDFKAQRDPYGKAWKPLTSSTLAARRLGGGGAKALLDTTETQRSLVLHNPGPRRARWGASLPGRRVAAHNKGAVIHPFGNKALTVELPKRQFIPDASAGIPSSMIANLKKAMPRLLDKGGGR